ncbi:MAG: DUF11 domain-containing protein [Thermoflexales bacterium]|nr:DUF11 domain-containing protein [Thermoflexales bacterium]
MKQKLIAPILSLVGAGLFVATVLIAAPLPTLAQIPITPGLTIYTQTFDTLANSGVHTWTDDSTLLAWYSNQAAYSADDGLSNTGGLYSYGPDGSPERALGSMGTGTANPILYGVRFRNTADFALSGFVISYTGEQWRSGRAHNTLEFAYQVGAVVTDISSGAWTAAPALNLVGPVIGNPTGPISPPVQIPTSGALNTQVLPGQEIMFRWQDVDDWNMDQGLAVDDLSILPQTSSILTMTKRIEPSGIISYHSAVTYTIVLSNLGGLLEPAARISDSLPAGVDFAGWLVQPSGATQDGDLVSWSGSLSATQALTLAFSAAHTGSYGDVIANTAEYTGVGGIGSATATFKVEAELLPELQVSKQVSLSEVFVYDGQSALVTYTIAVSNTGIGEARDVVLTDTLPVGFDYVSDTSGVPPTMVDGSLVWELGNLPLASLAGSRYFQLIASATEAITQSRLYTNQASVTAANDLGGAIANASLWVWRIVPIAAARAGADGETFAIEGRVIVVPGTFRASEWALQDSSGGIAVSYTPPPAVALGDSVRLAGTRSTWNEQEQMTAPDLFVNLGPGLEPAPISYATGDAAAGLSEGWLTHLRGRVSGLVDCPSTSGYQFLLDDGSGAATVMIVLGTGIDVCQMGVTNTSYIHVVGFSTQSLAGYQLRPRQPADIILPVEYTWTGEQGTDWGNPGNWVSSAGTAPGRYDRATIPSVASNWPIVAALARADKLTIAPGAYLTVTKGHTLTVESSLVNSGTLALTQYVAGASRARFHIYNSAALPVYYGLVISPSASMGDIGVTIRGGQCGEAGTLPQTIRRCFGIAPQIASTAVITFFYQADEANGNINPQVYHWTPPAWITQTFYANGSPDADWQWVAAWVSNYSPFALKDPATGDPGAPTSVTVRSLVARQALPVLLAAGLLILAAAGLVLARRTV